MRSTGLGWGWGEKRSECLEPLHQLPPPNNRPSPPSISSTPVLITAPPPPLQFFYQNWREFLFEPDILLLMTALAAGPPQLFLADLMLAFGGKPLLCESGVEMCGSRSAMDQTLAVAVGLSSYPGPPLRPSPPHAPFPPSIHFHCSSSVFLSSAHSPSSSLHQASFPLLRLLSRSCLWRSAAAGRDWRRACAYHNNYPC